MKTTFKSLLIATICCILLVVTIKSVTGYPYAVAIQQIASQIARLFN